MASYLTIQLFLIFACFVASSYQCQGSILTATSSPAFLEGTECDDVFITGNGNTVQIYAGRGSDRVVLGSNQAVWIADFSDNEDSLDASALPSWGTVASEGDFSISSSSNGAVILQRSTNTTVTLQNYSPSEVLVSFFILPAFTGQRTQVLMPSDYTGSPQFTPVTCPPTTKQSVVSSASSNAEFATLVAISWAVIHLAL